MIELRFKKNEIVSDVNMYDMVEYWADEFKSYGATVCKCDDTHEIKIQVNNVKVKDFIISLNKALKPFTKFEGMPIGDELWMRTDIDEGIKNMVFGIIIVYSWHEWAKVSK